MTSKFAQAKIANMKKAAWTASARAAPAASDVNATQKSTIRNDQCGEVSEPASRPRFQDDFMLVLPGRAGFSPPSPLGGLKPTLRERLFLRKFVTTGIKHSSCQTTRSRRTRLPNREIRTYNGICGP